MAIEKPRKPWLWPALFLGAFLIGGLLWAVWMWQFVQKERRMQRDEMTAPAPERR